VSSEANIVMFSAMMRCMYEAFSTVDLLGQNQLPSAQQMRDFSGCALSRKKVPVAAQPSGLRFCGVHQPLRRLEREETFASRF
jgi:hypothetical protein